MVAHYCRRIGSHNLGIDGTLAVFRRTEDHNELVWTINWGLVTLAALLAWADLALENPA